MGAQGIKDAPIPYGSHTLKHNIQEFRQPDNKWICYEWHFKLNTAGQKDGLYEQYATNVTDNGPAILTSRHANREFLGATPNDIMPSDSKWFRMRNYRQDGVGQMWYDNQTVSTTRIGCAGGGGGGGDTQVPTVPANLNAQAMSSSQINLTWAASTDNVGVAGYRIFRGGTQIGTTAGTSYSNTGLSASTAYSYTIAAYDAAGNASGQSTAASATTQASTPPAGAVGTVSNLSVASVGANSATLSFPEANDGTGQPAKYDIRYSSSGALWGGAPSVTQGTCATPLAGTTVGATKTCTVLGLSPSTLYQFQLIPFRGTMNAGAVYGSLSNTAGATTSSGADVMPPGKPKNMKVQ